MRTFARTAVITGIAALAVGMAGPASAAPIEKGRFHDVFPSDPYELCGLTVQDTIDIRGSFVVNPHGPDGLVYLVQNTHLTQTTTNLANNKSFTVVSNFVIKDQRVTDNGDGTLTILVLAAGGELVYGPDGEIIAHRPGQTRFEFLVDHGGTPTDLSDNEELEFLGIVKGSTGRNDEFDCPQILAAIG